MKALICYKGKEKNIKLIAICRIQLSVKYCALNYLFSEVREIVSKNLIMLVSNNKFMSIKLYSHLNILCRVQSQINP